MLHVALLLTVLRVVRLLRVCRLLRVGRLLRISLLLRGAGLLLMGLLLLRKGCWLGTHAMLAEPGGLAVRVAPVRRCAGRRGNLLSGRGRLGLLWGRRRDVENGVDLVRNGLQLGAELSLDSLKVAAVLVLFLSADQSPRMTFRN